MANTLVGALENLHLKSKDIANQDDWIDSVLDEHRPHKRVKQDQEDLKRELEKKYLTPSTTFSTEWLNRLQQYVPFPSLSLLRH